MASDMSAVVRLSLSTAWRLSPMDRIAAKVLVIGAGPAGLSAAVAACEQSEVTLVDENPNPGGQIWRAEKGKLTSADAANLVDAVSSGSVTTLRETTVFASIGPNCLA